MSLSELKIGTDLMIKPKLMVVGSQKKEINSEFIARNMGILSKIRNALNGVVADDDDAKLSKPQNFNANIMLTVSNREDTEDITESDYDPDRF